MTHTEQLRLAVDSGMIKAATPDMVKASGLGLVGLGLRGIGLGARAGAPTLRGLFGQGFAHSGRRIAAHGQKLYGGIQNQIGKRTGNRALRYNGLRRRRVAQDVIGKPNYAPRADGSIRRGGGLHPYNWPEKFRTMYGQGQYANAGGEALTGMQRLAYGAGRIPAMATYGSAAVMLPQWTIPQNIGRAQGWNDAKPNMSNYAYDEATKMMHLMNRASPQQRLGWAHDPGKYGQFLSRSENDPTGRWAENAYKRMYGGQKPQGLLNKAWDVVGDGSLAQMVFPAQRGPVESGRGWIDRWGANKITTTANKHLNVGQEKSGSEQMEKEAFMGALGMAGKVGMGLMFPAMAYLGGRRNSRNEAEQQVRGTVRATAYDRFANMPAWQRYMYGMAPNAGNQRIGPMLGEGYRDFYNANYRTDSPYGRRDSNKIHIPGSGANPLRFGPQFTNAPPSGSHGPPPPPKPNAIPQGYSSQRPLNVLGS